MCVLFGESLTKARPHETDLKDPAPPWIILLSSIGPCILLLESWGVEERSGGILMFIVETIERVHFDVDE
ncbi:unnamed protein product [Allacma fusca]|uniref:Uncharacterized protein n=1 Tax=Allacma fusca TaxID=39272 RepID=A0A8J2NNQ3_9HEXA|nr:unnamed protein product [Allacma fusca]